MFKPDKHVKIEHGKITQYAQATKFPRFAELFHEKPLLQRKMMELHERYERRDFDHGQFDLGDGFVLLIGDNANSFERFS